MHDYTFSLEKVGVSTATLGEILLKPSHTAEELELQDDDIIVIEPTGHAGSIKDRDFVDDDGMCDEQTGFRERAGYSLRSQKGNQRREEHRNIKDSDRTGNFDDLSDVESLVSETSNNE